MESGNANDHYTDKESQILGKEISNLKLGYLICPVDASNAFLGAVMITDYRVRPVHFSFVSPVRPTAIQKILFGSTLSSHVKIDVIAQKLLSNIPQIPDVYFVDDMEILPVRNIIKKPTAFLQKIAPSVSESSRLSTLEYKTGSNVEDQEIIGQVLASLESFVDLVEPFLRMRQALKEAIKSKES